MAIDREAAPTWVSRISFGCLMTTDNSVNLNPVPRKLLTLLV